MQRRRAPVLGLLLLAVLFSSIAHSAPYRITVLATNIADYGGLGEWSFAALFESQQDAVLFDTGLCHLVSSSRILSIVSWSDTEQWC